MECFSPGHIGQHINHYNGYGVDHEEKAAGGGMDLDGEAWHVFGMLWDEKEGYTFYVDGKEDGHIPGPISRIPQFIMLSTEVQGYRSKALAATDEARSAIMPINNRWNIQSGLTYSYLASDLSKSNQQVSYQTKQKLHYVGIPLQAGFRIWSSSRFNGYITAGGQVEKLISGKATTDYSENKKHQSTSTQKIHDKKPLFSALASVGVEYALNKHLYMYAEPGIHYYFKNGNGLKTTYNEHPLYFNITAGIRFNWNK